MISKSIDTRPLARNTEIQEETFVASPTASEPLLLSHPQEHGKERNVASAIPAQGTGSHARLTTTARVLGLEDGALRSTAHEFSARTTVHALNNTLNAHRAADSLNDVGNGEESISPQQQPSPVTSDATDIPTSLASRLYISHFLSTWNSRLFELGAVLFLSALFPGTLLQMSVYALARSGAAIIFSPALGSWIDSGNRLKVVRVSIVGQRMTVSASCGIFWIMLQRDDMYDRLKMVLFGLAVILACVEKLCAVLNLVAVERDWVVVITEDNEAARRVLNARMRRIDLFCKLLGPLVIALVNGASTLIAIWVTLGLNATSVLIEYFCISSVYRAVPALRRARRSNSPQTGNDVEVSLSQPLPHSQPNARRALTWFCTTISSLLQFRSFPIYFHHPAFLPSICLALLYLTVLSFSGQMITFLLSSGYSSSHVGIARTISTLFELSATWIAPRAVKRIGAVRCGIYALCWQMLWLAGGVSWLFADGEGLRKRDVTVTSGLVGGVILSRVGLWGFDLSAQSIIQEEVDEISRGAFSTVEASFQNLFELLSYASTIIFPRSDQFQWPVIMSAAAVYIAGGLYAMYVRRRRGHLLHQLPYLIHPMKPEGRRGDGSNIATL